MTPVMSPPKPRPILVLGFGNPSRGDDALGPAVIERLQSAPDLVATGARLLTDFQPQIEHVLDLEGCARVIFVDATMTGSAPFVHAPLSPAPETAYSTHALSPAVLLGLYRKVNGRAPPPAWLLAIRGERFALGEPLSPSARAHLDAAVAFLSELLRMPDRATLE